MTLYEKYRPQSLNDIVGHKSQVSILQTMLADDKLSHVILWTGASGSGKSSMAKIIATALGATPGNTTEINCASDRGIDVARQIGDSMRYKGLGGGKRIWLMEEVVQLPKTTQQAMLTFLEDVPDHVYFLLCSSDTTGLIPTFLSRCQIVALASLTNKDVMEILNRAVCNEKRELDGGVANAIVVKSNGNARQALQILEAVLAQEGEEAQLEAIGASTLVEEEKIEFLAKALLQRLPWKSFCKIIESIEEKDLEKVRRQVLAYFRKVLLGNNPESRKQARLVIHCFDTPFFASGTAGLAVACFDVIQPR